MDDALLAVSVYDLPFLFPLHPFPGTLPVPRRADRVEGFLRGAISVQMPFAVS
jgi:hypothetical protein